MGRKTQLLCNIFCKPCVFSSVRSSYTHPDLLVIHPPHFFRSHRSSTLDFHFLSHYSYIKAIMLYNLYINYINYKVNHWTQCAGFMDASWVRLGITNDDLGTSWALPGDNLGMTWGWLGHYFGKTWQDSGSGRLWHTLAYSGILCHTLAYSVILWHTLAYSGILWHTLAYSGILLHTLAFSDILWHTLAYSGTLWHTLA